MLQDYLQAYVSKAGFPAYTELRAQQNRSRAVGILNGSLYSNASSVSRGVSARVVKGGSYGFASATGYADDPAYQQIANVLSGLTCVRRFNQQYSSYSHEYPVDSVTVSYYDDAENNNLLFTVYSDGTAIVNSQFVKIKEPKGGAEEVYQKLAEIVK